MSGHKCTTVRDDQEQTRRAGALRNITGSCNEIEEVARKISQSLSRLSSTMQSHHAAELSGVARWESESRSVVLAARRLSRADALPGLNQTADGLATRLRNGLECHKRLKQISDRVDLTRREVRVSLQSVQATFDTQAAYLRQWLETDPTKEIQVALEETQRLLTQEDFVSAQNCLANAKRMISEHMSQAKNRETAQIHEESARALHEARRATLACAAMVRRSLSTASPGLQATFADASASGRQWLAETDRCGDLEGDNSSLNTMREATHRLLALTERGRAVEANLQKAYVMEASILRQDAIASNDTVDALLESGRDLIAAWFGSGEVTRLEDRFASARRALEEEYLTDVLSQSRDLATELTSRLEVARTQEEKHQRRLYIVQALRQVCNNMGFREVKEPDYEVPGDRGSRIVLQVDTLNRGTVSFHLSLDKIDANACISSGYCFHEFDQVSEKLSEHYGVQTRFEMADGSPRPPDKANDSLAEPARSSQSMNA